LCRSPIFRFDRDLPLLLIIGGLLGRRLTRPKGRRFLHTGIRIGLILRLAPLLFFIRDLSDRILMDALGFGFSPGLGHYSNLMTLLAG